jgi:hypothetical protein
MDFKNFLTEAGIVDTIKLEISAIESEVAKHILSHPDSVAPILLNRLKTAITSNHAGDIKVAKERLDKILNPDIKLDDPSSKPVENHDLKTELGTYKIQVYEIKNLLGSEDNQHFNNIQEKFKSVSSNANEIKKLNTELRNLRKHINQSRNVLKPINLFPAPGSTEKILNKSGILNPDGTVNKDSEGNMIIPKKQTLKKHSTGIDKFVSKLKKGLGTDKPVDSVEPAPEVSAEPKIAISDIGKPKSTSLVSQEKLLDDNKSTIPLDLYQMAKNAIKLANSSNDPEDIKIAEELINNALENA